MIRHARADDLPEIVRIYNASIPGRMATADTEPVTVAQREEWFRAFDPASRPLWVLEDGEGIEGWLGLRSFYGRPAYHRTVESAVYVDPARQRRHRSPHARPLAGRPRASQLQLAAHPRHPGRHRRINQLRPGHEELHVRGWKQRVVD